MQKHKGSQQQIEISDIFLSVSMKSEQAECKCGYKFRRTTALGLDPDHDYWFLLGEEGRHLKDDLLL